MDDRVARLLAALPAVHVLVDSAIAIGTQPQPPRWAVVEAARRAIANQRKAILSGVLPIDTAAHEHDVANMGAHVGASAAPAARDAALQPASAAGDAHVGATSVEAGREAERPLGRAPQHAHVGSTAATAARDVSLHPAIAAGDAPVGSTSVEADREPERPHTRAPEDAQVRVSTATAARDVALHPAVAAGDAHVGETSADVREGGRPRASAPECAHVGAPIGARDAPVDASIGSRDADVGASIGSRDAHVGASIASRAAHVGAARLASSIDPRDVAAAAAELARSPLRRVINATGVVLHTNLGRAPLAEAARRAIDEVAAGYSNLEYDLARGERGSRHDHLRELLRELTGAEDAIVVNNNAAATVLGLAALATDREIIVSRGELIEIGGSFRLPEILALSRGVLVEVGTTNKTHRRDYEAAIRPATGLLLKVHRSNFAIVGFTSEVAADELVAIGRAASVASMIDLGSGAVVDRATQRRWGLPDEPTVAETVATGADLVTFSGDKLLGGPQAGILVGRAAAVERARKHPLMRALRPDKLTLAALAATLALYRNHQLDAIPTTRMLGAPAPELHAAAVALAAAIGERPGLAVAVEPCSSTVGGGAMPTAQLASWAVTLRGRSADALDANLRRAAIPVIGRIEHGRVWLDLRTIASADLPDVVAAVRALDAR